MQDVWQMFIINVEEKQIITGKDDIKTEQGRKRDKTCQIQNMEQR